MNINKLASIAKNYDIENSKKLRYDIVFEYTETIGSLNTVEESVIDKNISLLPVYQINEKSSIEAVNEFLLNKKFLVQTKFHNDYIFTPKK